MRLARTVKMQNETGTICGHINTLPVDGYVYIISGHRVEQVYVDDLDTFSQNVVYQLIKRARRYYERN